MQGPHSHILELAHGSLPWTKRPSDDTVESYQNVPWDWYKHAKHILYEARFISAALFVAK